MMEQCYDAYGFEVLEAYSGQISSCQSDEQALSKCYNIQENYIGFVNFNKSGAS